MEWLFICLIGVLVFLLLAGKSKPQLSNESMDTSSTSSDRDLALQEMMATLETEVALINQINRKVSAQQETPQRSLELVKESQTLLRNLVKKTRAFPEIKLTQLQPLQKQLNDLESQIYQTIFGNKTESRVTVQAQSSKVDEPVSVGNKLPSEVERNFRTPSKPNGVGATKWVQPGESVVVAGVNLTGGLIYVGTSLSTAYGEEDPSLINPNKPVADWGSFTNPVGDYWPSYSSISKESRRAYLNWLMGGRNHPEADIGYVFLYFYGFERRAVIDAAKDSSAEKDLPIIATELRRLLAVYGGKSASFKRYANELLNWIEVSSFNPKLYLEPIPVFEKTWELPLYIRLALGRAALDGVPVPPPLALAWVKLDPGISLRTPATRCPEEFDKLFLLHYQQDFKAGLTLPRNKTKLRVVYRPSSSGLNGYNEIKLNFGETPDVSVLTAPIGKLRKIVEKATDELASYSRFLAKNPDQRGSLEGLLQLPVALWPEKAHTALKSLIGEMEKGFIALPYSELLGTFNTQSALSKDKVVGLAKALESFNVGMEPDVLSGAKVPGLNDTVVLFSHRGIEPLSRNSSAYNAALLTLQLSAAIAAADGEFSAQEIDHLANQLQSWQHLTPGHLERLAAHLRLLKYSPVSLPSLKKKLEVLDLPVKEALASFMVSVVQSDGIAGPAEIKMLEKLYKMLGLESKRVFSDVHAIAVAASPSMVPGSGANIEKVGFKLDTARIAELQKDTEKVSALLSDIFKEEESPTVAIVEPEEVPEVEDSAYEPGLLGLDEAHSSLARLLLSRPEWSREELLDVAADLDLMLDGALEQINEAAFDAYDSPLTEGEDPITVNTEILEKLKI